MSLSKPISALAPLGLWMEILPIILYAQEHNDVTDEYPVWLSLQYNRILVVLDSLT